MDHHSLIVLILSITLYGSSGYPTSDFKTFKIIPSDAIHDPRTKYISNYHSESDPVQEARNSEYSETAPEHRTGNIPLHVNVNHQESLKHFDKYHNANNHDGPEMKLAMPYPYIYNVDMDSPKTLQIAVEPQNNDTKFRITDSFLDSFLNPPVQRKIPTTKKPKKPSNKNPTNKSPKPNNQPESRPNKNVKQVAGAEDVDETQESTTSEPVTSQHSSQIQYNDLEGSSQIGNRESQMILKPTVIVNIRGTVTNSEGGLSLESRTGDIELSSSETKSKTPTRNIFHISQEINIDRKPSDFNEDSEETSSRDKDYLERKAPEERTIDFVLSSGQDEHRFNEKMSMFDDYSDFSLYR